MSGYGYFEPMSGGYTDPLMVPAYANNLNRYGVQLSSAGDVLGYKEDDAITPETGFWGRARHFIGETGKALTGLGGGIAAGATGGAALSGGNPYAAGAGGVIGGLAALPSTVGTIWDAIQTVRGKRTTNGGGNRGPDYNIPTDIQLIDNDYRYGNRGRTQIPGYVPVEAMNVIEASSLARPYYNDLDRINAYQASRNDRWSNFDDWSSEYGPSVAPVRDLIRYQDPRSLASDAIRVYG